MSTPRVINGSADRRGGFDSRYLPFLRAAEDRHFWFRARNTIIGTLVRQIEAELTSGYRVLEVGCGTGNTLRVLQAACTRGSILGIDFQREGLVYARERVPCPVVQGDVCDAPFVPSVRFNLIGMFDVLEHIDDDRRVLAALRSWMAPDGALLVTVPAGPRLWSTFDEAVRHRRRYTADELNRKLVDAGFRVEYLSPFMACLYPIMWARRRFPAVLRREQAGFDRTLDELRVIPIVNAALGWALSWEPARVGARRRLPFGTSLIAIARNPLKATDPEFL